MQTIIEEKLYDESSSLEERVAIKERIRLYDDNIIMYHEMPRQSVFHLNLFEEKILHLTAHLDEYYIVADLSEAKQPTAEIRARLKDMYSNLSGLKHFAVFTEKNFLINLAAKYVIASFNLKSYSIHKKKSEALAEIIKRKATNESLMQ